MLRDKNAVVGRILTVSLEMYQLVPLIRGEAEPNLILTHDLLACDVDDAPSFRWQNPTGSYLSFPELCSRTPANNIPLAVYKVCTLRANLSSLPRWRFTKQRNSFGQEFYNIPFHLKMTLVGEVLYFELLFEGARCGDVVAEYW